MEKQEIKITIVYTEVTQQTEKIMNKSPYNEVITK